MPTTPRLDRRALFSLAGASLLSRPGPVRLSMATGIASPGTILATPIQAAGLALDVAGPRDGELATWARMLAAPLAGGLMERGRLELCYSGGVDGVTGANQFDARASPDGREALLLPGSVALDWLTGLRQVRFDPAHVLPLLAVQGPGVLMARGALPAPGTSTKLRLYGGSHQTDVLVALLGLDLLGIPTILVRRQSEADAIFLTGPQEATQAPGLIATGYAAVLCTSATQAPYFLAALPETRLRQDGLVAAWHALASASALCAALLLPRLCPAAAIGRWRQAASACVADDGVVGQARRQSLHLAAGANAADALASMRLAAGPLLALRRWLSDHADTQPG